jgi:predicted KAP-like P-loop ATPase
VREIQAGTPLQQPGFCTTLALSRGTPKLHPKDERPPVRPFVSGELNPDKPRTDPEREDELGVAPFSKNLAQAIARVTPTQGLVIGLCGPWGSGKTTVLRFVEAYLRRETPSAPLLVIDFNPWWFSGEKDLIAAFLVELIAQARLNQSLTGKLTNLFEDLEPLLDGLARLAESTPHSSIPCFAWLGSSIAKLLHRRQSESLPELKRKITGALKSASTRLLVIIDDLDRLPSVQVQQIFRLVKSVADFPNVTYLMAFDREVISRTLENEQEVPGQTYLSKIVQIPFDLPRPDTTALHRMLFKRLDAILDPTPDELFDKGRWRDIFSDSLAKLLGTPRDIIRLANVLSLTYATVRGEVDAVDFIAVEALRVFLPQVYDVIRRNPEMVCEASWRSISPLTGAKLKMFHDTWFDALTKEGAIATEHRELVQALLCALFPRVNAVWSQSPSHRTSQRPSSATRRVCDADAFPVYFRWTVGETSISRSEVLAVLSLPSSELAKTLVEKSRSVRVDGISHVRALMEVLPDFAASLPVEGCQRLIEAMISAGEEILKADAAAFFPPQAWLFASSIRASVKGIPPNERFDSVASAIQKSSAVGAIVWITEEFARDVGRVGKTAERDQEILINGDDVQRLEQIALTKIREASANRELLNSATLANILYNWQRWAGEDEVRQWILATAETPKTLARMLERLLSTVVENGEARPRFDVEMLAKFIDPSTLVEKVRAQSGGGWMSEREMTAVDCFLKAYQLREHNS